MPIGALTPDDTGTVRIPVRSRRQAMDWSLVLTSQGIEVVIDQSPDAGWGLLIPAAEHARAAAAIGQYRVENRHWRWRQPFYQKQLIFDWTSLVWVALVGVCYWLSVRVLDLRALGMMDGEAVSHGQWWRLITAIFLHADLAHFASNAVFGFLLLGLAMGRFGGGVALLASFLAGVGGNLLAWLMDPGHRSLGASGMVMGCLGLLAVQSVSLLRENPHARRLVFSSLLAGVMLFVLLGLGPGTDVAAHAGGFICGVLFGGGLLFFPKLPQSWPANFVCGIVFGVLVGLAWALAMPGRAPG